MELETKRNFALREIRRWVIPIWWENIRDKREICMFLIPDTFNVKTCFLWSSRQ